MVPPRATNGDTHASSSGAKSLTDWYPLAQKELTNVVEALRQGTRHDLGEFPRIAVGIVESLRESDRLLLLALSGAPKEQLIRHSVNVSILAAKLGIGAEYQGEQLERLVLAGLLHDVGMFTMPEPLLMKSEPLTTSERELFEQHPLLGAEMLHRLGTPYRWLAQVALQEHERWGGQGYPNKIRGTEIDPLAQIIGLADLLDALLSHRPSCRRVLPHQAVREILVKEKSAFSRDIMKVLIEHISVYPLGTHVRLHTGEVGVVTKLNPQYPLRPVLHMNPTAESGPGKPEILDLSSNMLAHIVDVVGPADKEATE